MIAALLALTSFVSCSGFFNKDDDTVTPPIELAGTYWAQCVFDQCYYENDEPVYTEDFVYTFTETFCNYIYFKDESTMESYIYDSDTESFKLSNTCNYEWRYDAGSADGTGQKSTYLSGTDNFYYQHGNPDGVLSSQVDSLNPILIGGGLGDSYYYYGTTAPTKAVNIVDAELVKASN